MENITIIDNAMNNDQDKNSCNQQLWLAMRREEPRLVFLTLLFYLLFAFLPGMLPGQETTGEKETRQKIVIISQIFNFVTWPPNHLPTSKEFLLGFIGDAPLYRQREILLENIAIPGRSVHIQSITRLDEIKECHALFIAGDQSSRLKDILAVTGQRPILVISDTAGFGNRGVLLNLFIEDERVKFEINLGAAKKSRLFLSSKLLKLARIIETIE